MESKGRRAGRAAAPGTIPAESVNLAATSSGGGNSGEGPAEEFIPAEAPVEVAAPVVTVAAPPSVDKLAAAAKNASGEEVADFGREVFPGLVQSQAAVVRGLEAMRPGGPGPAMSG